ncbi:hypothetical protein SCATT_p00960 (plasmid) [Streptantibioticus cattleyicolor NRRL 8057 = DSM 46488]|uniref:Uncharacterized protein n=1 Tax=Streptantibioticus cattleyicolor (strain ATCC 35852 / DSM 46488 / JCM 4925 / NBRC 14057 / NRRL 8057) TaxID=1003195 RepID=G8XE24_STREN|nr:hypothetical protein SCATT_p00960 [Streptantibioticus cattleyicolor NRRL 8057 = DSM 46488]
MPVRRRDLTRRGRRRRRHRRGGERKAPAVIRSPPPGGQRSGRLSTVNTGLAGGAPRRKVSIWELVTGNRQPAPAHRDAGDRAGPRVDMVGDLAGRSDRRVFLSGCEAKAVGANPAGVPESAGHVTL